MALVRPEVVDVSSGVERLPGIKDPDKIARFWRRCLATALSVLSGRSEGRFGPYGGRYVPETLVAALDDLTALYDAVRGDPAFWAELDALLAEFVGRPVAALRGAPSRRRRSARRCCSSGRT